MHNVNIMAPCPGYILYIRLEKYKTRQLFGLVCGRFGPRTMRIHFHFTFTRLISHSRRVAFQAPDEIFPSSRNYLRVFNSIFCFRPRMEFSRTHDHQAASVLQPSGREVESAGLRLESREVRVYSTSVL